MEVPIFIEQGVLDVEAALPHTLFLLLPHLTLGWKISCSKASHTTVTSGKRNMSLILEIQAFRGPHALPRYPRVEAVYNARVRKLDKSYRACLSEGGTFVPTPKESVREDRNNTANIVLRGQLLDSSFASFAREPSTYHGVPSDHQSKFFRHTRLAIASHIGVIVRLAPDCETPTDGYVCQ